MTKSCFESHKKSKFSPDGNLGRSERVLFRQQQGGLIPAFSQNLRLSSRVVASGGDSKQPAAMTTLLTTVKPIASFAAACDVPRTSPVDGDLTSIPAVSSAFRIATVLSEEAVATATKGTTF